jgi:predicted nucleotide-binding protein
VLTLTGRVFIVHGRDHGIKNAVARYVEKLDLNAVILHEQPDRGQTVIAKFLNEAHGDFAVVLATHDDLAALQEKIDATKAEDVKTVLKGRARQNVLFELGYFASKIGVGRVMLITEPGVEIPSDLDGIIYTARSDWQGKLWVALSDIGHEQFTKDQIRQATAIRDT